MNKTERIPIDLNNPTQDKYVFFDLQQDVSTYEILTLKIDQKDFYQYFNADYGVLIGRVIANNNVGVPNAKISIFIPLTDVDKNVGNIVSIYPYTMPRDLNQEGKRYNLLPRVATYNQQTGTYKPKQPFGSFPIKEEVVTNSNYLDVYKKYYKYTALTNENGDYMIFGVPTGTQTVHLSVDITDIGTYSMTPESMVVNLGYSPYLFTNNNTEIKPSDDLTILPNIEVQEISVDVIPYWGDTENFTIGITRQDFRIRAEIKSNFIVFGTSMTMGTNTTVGDPDKYGGVGQANSGFYLLSDNTPNNVDIRTYRPASFNIRVFSYKPTVLESDIISGNVDPQNDIYELSKTEYYEYNQNGDFLLSIACNRAKVVTNEFGYETPVSDNSPYGIFTKFYGMFIVEYSIEGVPITKTFSTDFNGPNHAHPQRGKFKIPQHVALDQAETVNTNAWRKEYFLFEKSKIYSVAQFLPTKWKEGNNGAPISVVANALHTANVLGVTGSTNVDVNFIAGSFFKVAGKNRVDQSQVDTLNYVGAPPTTAIPYFTYDFPYNSENIPSADPTDKFFGAQWLNLSLVFPQYVYAFESGNNRDYNVADIFYNNYDTTHFVQDNSQKVFANINNTAQFLKGDAYQTDFIEIPSTEIAKLNSDVITYGGRTLQDIKGLNITTINDTLGTSFLDLTPYKYRKPTYVSNGRAYNIAAWDIHQTNGEYILSTGTSYLFKGMYDNNCIKLLFDLNIL